MTTASRQTTIRTTQQFPSLKSAVAGDVNGDGWQDLLVGSSLVTQFNSTGTSIVLQNLVSPASNATPMTLGDLNADGYDDFGLSHVNRLDIFLGKQNTSYILSDILGSVPYFRVTGRGLSATEGDFNADGIPDLAVASLASLAAGGEQLSVFWSLVNRSSGPLTLADANVTFPIWRREWWVTSVCRCRSLTSTTTASKIWLSARTCLPGRRVTTRAEST